MPLSLRPSPAVALSLLFSVSCGVGPSAIDREDVTEEDRYEASRIVAEVDGHLARGEFEVAAEKAALIDETDPYSPRAAMAVARAGAGLAAKLGNPRVYHDAVKRADSAVDAAPDDAEIRYQRGVMQFNRRYYTAAVADFVRVTELNAGHVEARRMQAFSHRRLRQPKLERKAWEALLAAAPKDAGGHYFLATLLLQSDLAADHVLGEQHLRQAIEADPSNRLALQALAFLEFERQEFAAAEAHLRQAANVATAAATGVPRMVPVPIPPQPGEEGPIEQLSPEAATEAEALYSLGTVLQAQAKSKEAVEVYERCLTIDPLHVRASGNIGKILCDLGDFDQGLRRLRDAAAAEEDNSVKKLIDAEILAVTERLKLQRELELQPGFDPAKPAQPASPAPPSPPPSAPVKPDQDGR